MLEKLSNAFGPSGYEFEVKDIITNFMQKYCDEIIIDKIGNIICHKNGYSVNNKSIMLTSHMDEVGFIINYITDDGYLKFKSVGGIDYKILVSKKVIIGKNKICGVIGNMPVHLKKNNNENINIEDLYIDIGAKNKDDALNYVQIGDYACFDSKFTKFGDDLIKGKALDDRIGCYLLIETLKRIG
ncbi:MAG: M42 family peptidase, partial [Clostridia bacterium]|nr:M42 family peptidase [Clostridia bacterium]